MKRRSVCERSALKFDASSLGLKQKGFKMYALPYPCCRASLPGNVSTVGDAAGPTGASSNFTGASSNLYLRSLH